MAHPRRRRSSLLVAAILAFMFVFPAAVWASHQFTDVPDSNVFHNSIGWMKDNGITVGCNPPANTKYCPDDPVTRGQMAAFMKRLAENNVVDAATLDGMDSSEFATKSDLSTTGTVTMGAGSFTASGTAATWSNGCVRDETSPFQVRASVQLPVGATITSFTGYVVDADGGANGNVRLVRTTAVTTTMATATTSGSAGLQNVTVNLATPEPVDATDYFYVEYTGGSGSGSHQICGVSIGYSIPAGTSLLGNSNGVADSGPATGS
ncbi:MAG: S-layer homology domain-containing protein [Acidimicrobiia bacterium]